MMGPAGLAVYLVVKTFWINGKPVLKGVSTLKVLYCLTTALCAFMIFWVLIFPATMLVGNLVGHIQFLEEMWGPESMKPTPLKLVTKYDGHLLVQLTHQLPSLLWSAAIPIQLHPAVRSVYPKLHRATGYALFAASFTMMVGFVDTMTKCDLIQGIYCWGGHNYLTVAKYGGLPSIVHPPTTNQYIYIYISEVYTYMFFFQYMLLTCPATPLFFSFLSVK